MLMVYVWLVFFLFVRKVLLQNIYFCMTENTLLDRDTNLCVGIYYLLLNRGENVFNFTVT